MNRRRISQSVLLGILVFALASSTFSPLPAGEIFRGNKPGLAGSSNGFPLYFLENMDLVHEDVCYILQGSDKTLYFTSDGVTFALMDQEALADETKDTPPSIDHWAVKLDFIGADPAVVPEGVEKQDTTFSYFKGKREDWKVGVPAFRKLIYRDLWPGIDLVYSGTSDQVKYEFVVKPKADPNQIHLAYRGATKVEIAESGVLKISTPLGEFEDAKPYAYQDVAGKQKPVSMAYHPVESSQTGAFHYGFQIGEYDSTLPLVLDPAMLLYCGYIGGDDNDYGWAIDVDADGYAYVTGFARSAEDTFPTVVGPSTTSAGSMDAFVAKVNQDGTGLVYCGFIGGLWDDRGRGIGVDGQGHVIVVGDTRSDESTFPVVVGPDLVFKGGWDSFIAKLSPNGNNLLFCGYIGGFSNDFVEDVALDFSGYPYVTGQTYSSEASFPVTIGPDLTYNWGYDVFVAKVDTDGSSLIYCGYIGGLYSDYGTGIVVDNFGNAFVVGHTTCSQSENFPVLGGPDVTFNGGSSDAFIAMVLPGGTDLSYCGYIGGESSDKAYDVAIDLVGYIYITGQTLSTEDTFPVHIGPDVTHNGSSDAFVAKLALDGQSLLYCGYIGGSGYDSGDAIAADYLGRIYVTGAASSTEESFPVLLGPDLTHNGGDDAFVTLVDEFGDSLVYSGFIGGSANDYGYDIAVDFNLDAYLTGKTASDEGSFPVTVGPDLTYNSGANDIYVAKIPADHILTRRGNVNTGLGDAVDVLFINGSAGDNNRVYTVSSGTQLIMTMTAPPAGPATAPFVLYDIWWEPGSGDLGYHPFNIGTSSIPTPITNGSPIPPPATVANNIGHQGILGSPMLRLVPPAPCTVFDISDLPPGVYSCQGIILDNGTSGPGVSLTNTIVLKVE